jgi:D-glycero-alpha-D-manno-heptose-7-phosphate kinase
MLISKTPLRVSFFGGGTDFPEYFNSKKTRVIGTSINKYIYVFQNKFHSNFFNHNLRLFYRNNEFVKKVKDIKHQVFRGVLQDANINKDIEIHVSSEMPSFVGLGTSSSFTVGLINLINNFKYKSHLHSKILADKAIFLERVRLKENVGYQDQILAAYGGFNSIELSKEGYKVKKISPKFSIKKFSQKLYLVYTEIQRRADKIEQKKINKLNVNLSYLDTISDIANEAYKCFINSNNTDFFGKLLNETWTQKKKLHALVSNSIINDIYDKAIDAGASGGKLLGAGAGGFILFYVEDNNKNKFLRAFNNKQYIKFDFENLGSKIIKV